MGAEVSGLALPPHTDPNIYTLTAQPLGADSFGDVRDAKTVADAFARARPEVVIHMAAQSLVQPSYEDPINTFETNVMGLVQLLNAARVAPSVRVIVNVTSDKCYENSEQIWGYRETEPMGGSDPYSASKGCAELVTASFRRSFFNRPEGPYLASARAGNVIGGGDWSKGRLLPDCARAFTAKETVVLRSPEATRPWQHVLEPISGYLTLAEHLWERGGEVAEGWNFGPDDAEAWPVRRIVDRVANLWGDGANWRLDDAHWKREANLLRVDATKARLQLGWRPRLTIDEALCWTLDWYKAVDGGESALPVTLAQIERYERLRDPPEMEPS
jgi:CDP-glucose 4,6-dehydratase